MASIMRRCMAGTLSPPYPAMFKSVFTSIAFRGSKPTLPCSERAIPRTATSEEVTSSAQIATCTTSSRSRDGNPPPSHAGGSRFDDLVCIGPEHLANGTMPKRMPLTSAKTKATA